MELEVALGVVGGPIAERPLCHMECVLLDLSLSVNEW
jgi:hypothetical protein